MGFTLYNLVKVTLLVANAGAVLHPQRFLRKYGMETADGSGGVKSQLSTAFAAMRQLRWPLLLMNLLVVVIELLFG